MRDRNELIRQIKAYKLDDKLQELARNSEQQRPFHHLPKQFSKGILIGNIAIVPRRADETRFVYVIADMVQAKILHEDIHLKQSAILIAHYLADGKEVPDRILDLDSQFASRIFEIKSFKLKWRSFEKNKDESQSFIYENKYIEANLKADEIKEKIQTVFDNTFKYK
jgi:hypothetical protein